MTVQHFKMGADIPEWLLSADPVQAGAPKGNFRFACDCNVFEAETYFLVHPLQGGPYPIDDSGMAAHNVYATSKDVLLVLSQNGFSTLDRANWTQHRPGLEPVEVVPVPDTHRTFWQRLRYVFSPAGRPR